MSARWYNADVFLADAVSKYDEPHDVNDRDEEDRWWWPPALGWPEPTPEPWGPLFKPLLIPGNKEIKSKVNTWNKKSQNFMQQNN